MGSIDRSFWGVRDHTLTEESENRATKREESSEITTLFKLHTGGQHWSNYTHRGITPVKLHTMGDNIGQTTHTGGQHRSNYTHWEATLVRLHTQGDNIGQTTHTGGQHRSDYTHTGGQHRSDYTHTGGQHRSDYTHRGTTLVKLHTPGDNIGQTTQRG